MDRRFDLFGVDVDLVDLILEGGFNLDGGDLFR